MMFRHLKRVVRIPAVQLYTLSLLVIVCFLLAGLLKPHVHTPTRIMPRLGIHYPAPPIPNNHNLNTGAGLWYVHGVHLYNNRQALDISALINRAGDQFRVSPIFIAAVIFTESGGNPFAERWAGGLDDSCGLMQQIIANVYLRIGYVGPRTACNWEEIPQNSITFGADILSQNNAQHGGRVPPPWAYGMYNAGSGWPDAWYFHMGGTAYVNYTYNFLPWWQYANAVWAFLPPPPPPRPHFPFKAWGTAISPWWHGQLSMTARFWWEGHSAGHPIWTRYVWRRHGFQETVVRGRRHTRTIYCWPSYNRCKESR